MNLVLNLRCGASCRVWLSGLVKMLIVWLVVFSVGATKSVNALNTGSADLRISNEYVVPPANLASSPYPEWAHYHW